VLDDIRRSTVIEVSMSAFETVKKLTEKATGWARPAKTALTKLIRPRKPHLFRLRDDGVIPNHPIFPVFVCKGAILFPKQMDPAAVFEDLFEKNGWSDSWRDGIYDYLHYHSQIHEVLGIARGSG
jgi:hypothetical protein